MSDFKNKKIVIKRNTLLAVFNFCLALVFIPVAFYILIQLVTGKTTISISTGITLIVATLAVIEAVPNCIGIIKFGLRKLDLDQSGLTMYHNFSKKTQKWHDVKSIDISGLGNQQSLIFNFRDDSKYTFDLTDLPFTYDEEEIRDLIFDYYQNAKK